MPKMGGPMGSKSGRFGSLVGVLAVALAGALGLGALATSASANRSPSALQVGAPSGWWKVPTVPETARFSVDSLGRQADGGSGGSSMSADGRFVAFSSWATNLVANDTNDRWDIFVRDSDAQATERVSVGFKRQQSNGHSDNPSIGGEDGRLVAFDSSGTNLDGWNDTNSADDVFVHNRDTHETERVSVNSFGELADHGAAEPAISKDGRFVAFISPSTNLVAGDNNGVYDIFVHNRDTHETERVSVSTSGDQANGDSIGAAISADGRYVSFQSIASNLVAGDTNRAPDIFVHDRVTHETERVSVSTSGGQGNDETWPEQSSISDDGHYVAFTSAASNMVGGDTNGTTDVFVRDRTAGTTERVSVSSGGAQGDLGSATPVITGDGRDVAFYSAATNLVADDTNDAFDVFIHDRYTQETERASLGSQGQQGDNHSFGPSLSADGRLVAFESDASNLVADDTNGKQDIFVRDRGACYRWGPRC